MKVVASVIRTCLLVVHAVVQLVKALCYKPEGLGFDSRLCHWNFSLTQSFRPHYGSGVDSASNSNGQVSPFHRPRRPSGRVEVQLYSILDLCTRRGEGSASRPGSTLPPGKDPVPIVQLAGWASGPVWTGSENLAPPGLDPWTVQPVGSRYTG